MKFKKGDRVLVESIVEGDEDDSMHVLVRDLRRPGDGRFVPSFCCVRPLTPPPGDDTTALRDELAMRLFADRSAQKHTDTLEERALAALLDADAFIAAKRRHDGGADA